MAPRLSRKRIATINGARLDDVAGVRTLRAAATAPHLWVYVHPTVDDTLVPLLVKADVIGLTRDELLAEIEDYLGNAAKMHTPVMPALAFVEWCLDLRLEAHHDATIAHEATMGTRRALTAPARDQKRVGADTRAEGWLREDRDDAGGLAQEGGRGRHRRPRRDDAGGPPEAPRPIPPAAATEEIAMTF